jgi:hypothetical protein
MLAGLGKLDLDSIHWAIVGGESGPKSRPMNVEWVTEVRDQCLSARVPFFFKQWGSTNKKKAGRLLEGRLWDEMPLSPQLASRGLERQSGPVAPDIYTLASSRQLSRRSTDSQVCRGRDRSAKLELEAGTVPT